MGHSVDDAVHKLKRKSIGRISGKFWYRFILKSSTELYTKNIYLYYTCRMPLYVIYKKISLINKLT